MNATASLIHQALHDIAIGTAMQGGFFAGALAFEGVPHGLVVSPKALGDFEPQIWIADYADVSGALSLTDGLANTRAMAAAGSELAQRAVAAEIAGFTDWYIGALDENEILYRNLKPTTDENSQWLRSGINLSAIPPTWPYTADLPAQAAIEAFRAGGAEAFEPVGYWTSTQHAGGSGNAWYQGFHYGLQSRWLKGLKLRARLVRRFAL